MSFCETLFGQVNCCKLYLCAFFWLMPWRLIQFLQLYYEFVWHPSFHTTRKQAISGAPKRLSVAHGGCATVSSPLKCVFCGACLGAPQKAQVSVAHCTGCATEIFQWRISLVCATETKIHAPQNNLQVFWNCCCLLYKYRYIYRIYTDIIETIIYLTRYMKTDTLLCHHIT